MINKLLFIILLSSFSVFSVTAQTQFRFGPEFGISLTDISNQKDDVNWTNEELKAIKSPLIGFTGAINIKKYVQFSLGLNYEKSGFYFPGNSFETPEKIIYNKLCFPLIARISSASKKINPGIFIGYRPTLLTKGRWEVLKTIKDPFEVENQAERFTGQIVFGVSVSISKDWVFSASYSKGKEVDCYYIHSFTTYSGNLITGPVYISYQNDEFALSVSYFFRTAGRVENRK